MPKFKPPRLKKTTIRGGRIYKTFMRSPQISLEQARANQSKQVEAFPAQVDETPQEIHLEHGEDVHVQEEPALSSSYARQRFQERQAWEKVKKDIRLSFYESSCPSEGASCNVCGEMPEWPVTCRDCSHSMQVFCKECAIQMHIKYNFLHTLIEWKDGHPSIARYQFTLSGQNHGCNSIAVRSIKVFNDRGDLHTLFVPFCNCEPQAATLVRYGLWPCSATMPTTAISLKLMDIIHCMVMEGQISLRAVCSAIKQHCFLQDSEANLLYRSMVGECMDQFRYFRFMIRSLADADIRRDWKPMECPACPKTGAVFVSLDANFGLVRKRSSGTSDLPPNHSNAVFLNDAEVQQFVRDYDESSRARRQEESNKECSNFQAATAIRTKNQTKKLATTGVFGSACRHGVPVVFLNMEHGERLAYPVMTIQKIMEGSAYPREVIFLYDIACKLHAHLQKRGSAGQDIKMYVPVFHSYGHKRSCQISFGSRWCTGVGLTDGEIMERIWAFLRKFSHITKEMTPSHRIDLLTDALYYFTEKKLDSIDFYMSSRMRHAEKIEETSERELKTILQECQGTLADVASWKETEKLSISSKQPSEGEPFSLSWDEKYVKQIIEYNLLRDQLQLCSDTQRVAILNTNCEKLDLSLQKTERDHKIRTRWQAGDEEFIQANTRRETKKKQELLTNIHSKACEHAFTVFCRRNYSGGQTVAARISKQIKATSASLRKAVSQYNESGFSCGEFPNSLSYEEVVNPESPTYTDIQASSLTSHQKNAVDWYNKLERAKEEGELIKVEMKQYLSSCKEAHLTLSQTVVNMKDEDVQWKKGMKHHLMVKIMHIEKKYEQAASAFRQYIGNIPHLYTTDNEDPPLIDDRLSSDPDHDSSDVGGDEDVW